MKKSNEVLLLAALIAAALVVPSLSAEEPAAGKPDRRERWQERREEVRDNLQKMAEELGLTAEQKTQIKAIHEGNRGKLQAIRDDASLSQDQKREQAKALRQSTQAKVDALLTPEQRVKAKELRAKHGRGGDKPHGEKAPGQ